MNPEIKFIYVEFNYKKEHGLYFSKHDLLYKFVK